MSGDRKVAKVGDRIVTDGLSRHGYKEAIITRVATSPRFDGEVHRVEVVYLNWLGNKRKKWISGFDLSYIEVPDAD